MSCESRPDRRERPAPARAHPTRGSGGSLPGLGDLVDERRRDSQDDLLSALVTERGGDGEVLEHPDQAALVRDDARVVTTATEELVRFDSSVQITNRVALADTEIAGVPVAAGDRLVCCLGAPLARLEVQLALPRLLARYPHLRLDGTPQRREGLTLRGYLSLPVAV